MNKIHILKGITGALFGLAIGIFVFLLLPSVFMTGFVLNILFGLLIVITLIAIGLKTTSTDVNYFVILFSFCVFSFCLYIKTSLDDINKKYDQTFDHSLDQSFGKTFGHFYVIQSSSGIILQEYSAFKRIVGEVLAVTDLSSTNDYQQQFSNTLQTAQIFKVDGTLEIVYKVEWGHTLFGPKENLARKDSIDQVVKERLTYQLNLKLQGCTNAWGLDVDVQNLPQEVRSARFTGNVKLG